MASLGSAAARVRPELLRRNGQFAFGTLLNEAVRHGVRLEAPQARLAFRVIVAVPRARPTLI